MAKNIVIQLYFFLSYLAGFGQTINYSDIGFLPEDLDECSGTVYVEPNFLFHINDSGNKPEIFVTDTAGKLLFRRHIEGLANKDWEELTTDQEGNLYIGDFGNNLNRRKDLVIYKLKSRDIIDEVKDLQWEEIHFSYEDQSGFPPSWNDRNYDMEAMVHRDHNLYLFSKNRTRPFDGYTYCYKLPDSAGTFVAVKVDSFHTGNGVMESYWISGATYNENSEKLVLLGYDKLWTFSGFGPDKFFDGKQSLQYFNNFSQKEAIAFLSPSEMVFTEEKNSRKDGKLYKVNLKNVPFHTSPQVRDSTSATAFLRYNEFQDQLDIILYCNDHCKAVWEVFDTEGKRLHYGIIKNLKKGINEETLNTKEWKHGGYVINIILNEAPHAYSIRKPYVN